MFSTGAGGALATFGFELPTDEDEAAVGRSYRSGTTTDFWVGSTLAFSKFADGDDDEVAAVSAEPGAAAPGTIGTATPWAAKSLSLSRATVDEFVGQVERSLMVSPLLLIDNLSNFS